MSTHRGHHATAAVAGYRPEKTLPGEEGDFLPPSASVKALDGVSFSLERGKTLAVVGESGCGKSTLGRLLTMIETPTGGELYYQGRGSAQARSAGAEAASPENPDCVPEPVRFFKPA